MSLNNHKTVASTAFLLIILTISIVSVSFGLQSSNTIPATGIISYWPRVDIAVDVSRVIGVNNLSLGFQLDWNRWKTFVDRPAQRQLAQEAGFGLVRVFDFRPTNPRLMPCTYWNETSKTGTWNWANVDLLTQRIFEIGAEPLFCLGYVRPNIENYIPPGMAVNPETGLPYPESYAAYAAEWVKHFEQLGLPVRFYEIGNEPMAYFGWSSVDITKLSYYVELWNYAARAMRQQNPDIFISTDAITRKQVFDYWLIHGDDVDYLDFHKYDAGTIGECTDSEMFRRAERIRFETTTTTYGIDDARQKWLTSRGKLLPVVNSESNFNSAWETGTDPKIQQMSGAVWLALVLRQGVLRGLDYNIYFEFSSSKSWQETHGVGWGFGMINEDDNRPWYPYYVHKMVGENLGVGNTLIETSSNSDEIRVLSWLSNGILNTLLICKVDEPRIIYLNGSFSTNIDILKIDNTVSHETPYIQKEILTVNEPLVLNGYAVALLQCSVSF